MCKDRRVKGIHLRYLDEPLRVVEGVGVFQKGTVAFVPRDLAVQLIRSGSFEAVTKGPTAQAFIVRIGQDTIPSGEEAPPTRAEPEGPADFELELEEEERRLTEEPKPPASGS
jgi:hypothetical protein